MSTKNAFTLVELLVVVTIITMLAGFSMLALSGSMQNAREMKTLATIQKLDVAMSEIFESLEDQEPDVDVTKLAAATGIANPSAGQIALAKLHFYRDYMRMLRPGNWDEVAYDLNPTNASGGVPVRYKHQLCFGTGTNAYGVERPAVFEYYLKGYKAIGGLSNDPSGITRQEFADSELLYLMIANLNPEALENFRGNEVGDVDDNGLLEFHDAWGKPIRYLRWAPAFTGTDKQPDIIRGASVALGMNNTSKWNNGPQSVGTWPPSNSPTNEAERIELAFYKAAVNYHDPFDPNGVRRGWFLYPLIYSAGPDEIPDINMVSVEIIRNGTPVTGWSINVNTPVIYDPFSLATGIPGDYDGNGTLNHLDNIHNHRHSGGF